jgi:hypothetical protein
VLLVEMRDDFRERHVRPRIDQRQDFRGMSLQPMRALVAPRHGNGGATAAGRCPYGATAAAI